MDEAEMPPPQRTTLPWHRSHLPGVLLHEVNGFGDRSTPPETAGAEDGTCMPRKRLMEAGPGGSAKCRTGTPQCLSRLLKEINFKSRWFN